MSSFRYRLALPCQRILRLFLYDTKLEFDVPTIIDVKLPSRECFPSNVVRIIETWWVEVYCVVPFFTLRIDGLLAKGPIFTNHCFERRGSTTTSVRSE